MRNYQSKTNKGGVADSINVERFGAGEFNSIAVELENSVSSSDQTLAPADGTGETSTQLAMALSIYGAGGAAYHVDTGAANAYVLNPISPRESPPAYFDGFTISFIPANANTGASTVNVNSIGSKSITTIDGAALSGGEINGNVKIRYDLSNDRFNLIQSGMGPTVSIFTSSGSYSKPDGLKFVEVTVVGGGGGGGGVGATPGGERAEASGGGGGGASKAIVMANSLAASETVTVGAGGTGGSSGAVNGSAGGSSSFGAHAVATGGSGGISMVSSSVDSLLIGGNGGIGTTGDLLISGCPGGAGTLVTITKIGGSTGGASILGGGGNYVVQSSDDGKNYGGGGSGANQNASQPATAGGDGADGVVIVKEFY